ncbi:beta-ribofuranosylaminobenzene 5'-phosphate synthase family protein [Prosthecomicrobium sp. N25]|uniref:beta-ribofuranosylaminobenzene 5'-phosphate synthase family protein n=1 Tax=Prosthecomicrobium sp. N25 TaxID=3129254 RepID=UPI003076A630
MARVQTRAEAVRVTAPARLHIGFLDLNGDLGRRFGSIGLAVDRPAATVRIRRAEVPSVSGAEVMRAHRYLKAACDALGLPMRHELVVAGTIPPHAGFGSGTQLALAIGAAVARLEGLPFEAGAMAARLDRGARSGIGVAAFETGGFVLDGGKGPGDRPPPIVARLPYPEDWRIVLVLDEAVDGVHGEAETAAFRALPRFPAEDAAHLCRVVLMRMLPALADRDLAAFGAAVSEVQARLGDHFAPAQGGGRFTSARVGAACRALEAAGAAGIGQSSWGPTGFALFGSEAEAERAVAGLAVNDRTPDGLYFVVARGRNHGARIEAEPDGG